ncbi:hypothetical protein BC938DRAFT_477177 [Jimgerdemannia flammicorona]|uniref:Uncharacterized protein n=1 Tax=Jimgerdemannia flammicorona TaxID=994334 RepID=A0A433QPP5_9FUNG|nr:hypothetical protein BC938DRAFT_477177 [Jimgerdemannia flammicorona]
MVRTSCTSSVREIGRRQGDVGKVYAIGIQGFDRHLHIYAMDWRVPGLYHFNKTLTSLNMWSNNISTKAIAKVLETNKLSPRRICSHITSAQRPSQGT